METYVFHIFHIFHICISYIYLFFNCLWACVIFKYINCCTVSVLMDYSGNKQIFCFPAYSVLLYYHQVQVLGSKSTITTTFKKIKLSLNMERGKKGVQVLYCDFAFYKINCLHRLIILKSVLQIAVRNKSSHFLLWQK